MIMISLQADSETVDMRQFVAFYVCYGMIIIEFITHNISDIDASIYAYHNVQEESNERSPLLGNIQHETQQRENISQRVGQHLSKMETRIYLFYNNK